MRKKIGFFLSIAFFFFCSSPLFSREATKRVRVAIRLYYQPQLEIESGDVNLDYQLSVNGVDKVQKHAFQVSGIVRNGYTLALGGENFVDNRLTLKKNGKEELTLRATLDRESTRTRGKFQDEQHAIHFSFDEQSEREVRALMAKEAQSMASGEVREFSGMVLIRATANK